MIRVHHNAKDIRIREVQVQPPGKTDTESYYTRAKSISGLHDLLSRHRRPNGKRVQVPVGDISGRRRRLSPRLQYLADRAISLKHQR